MSPQLITQDWQGVQVIYTFIHHLHFPALLHMFRTTIKWQTHIWKQLSPEWKKGLGNSSEMVEWSQVTQISWKSELELYKSISSRHSAWSHSSIQQICLILETCQRNEWGWRLLAECWGIYFQHSTMHMGIIHGRVGHVLTSFLIAQNWPYHNFDINCMCI